MATWEYVGPVMRFDKCIEGQWNAVTEAVSAKKALTNLAYRYKRQSGLTANTKISLPGSLKMLRDNA